MSDGFTLTADLEEALARVAELIDEMHVLGRKKAQAEKAYRVAKQQRILYERNHNNTPVSIINDVVKGYEDIAELKCVVDCAESDYDSNYEAILYWKKRADSYREQLQREWSRAEL